MPDPDASTPASTPSRGRLWWEIAIVLALGLGQSVVPLQAFPVTVSVQGAEAAGLRSVELAFTMQGMDMGILRTPLLRQADGSWRGRGLLPVCAAGRSDWLATVTATGADGERYRAQFAFPAGH